MTTIRATLAELREFIAAHPFEFRVGYLAAFLVPASLIVAGPLFVWAIFADTVAAAMGLGAWCWALRRRLAVERGRLAAARILLAERDAELKHADELITRLAADAACAPVPFIPVDGPRLRSVPMQRDGSEYEWPRLARQIEDDDLTALMRATEEK